MGVPLEPDFPRALFERLHSSLADSYHSLNGSFIRMAYAT